MKEIINCIIELGDKVIEHEEEIERLNKALDTATEIINNKQKPDIR